MALLSREAILAARDWKEEEVDVPEWGGTVRVRTITVADRMALQAAYKDGADGAIVAPEDVRTRMVALTLVDELGHKLFSFDDIEALNEKNPGVIDRIFAVAARLNVTRVIDLTDAVKNSEPSPSGASSTA